MKSIALPDLLASPDFVDFTEASEGWVLLSDFEGALNLPVCGCGVTYGAHEMSLETYISSSLELSKVVFMVVFVVTALQPGKH